jgi:hypothetical protein
VKHIFIIINTSETFPTSFKKNTFFIKYRVSYVYNHYEWYFHLYDLKIESLKNVQNDIIENVADSIQYCLFMNGSGKTLLHVYHLFYPIYLSQSNQRFHQLCWVHFHVYLNLKRKESEHYEEGFKKSFILRKLLVDFYFF